MLRNLKIAFEERDEKRRLNDSHWVKLEAYKEMERFYEAKRREAFIKGRVGWKQTKVTHSPTIMDKDGNEIPNPEYGN